MSFEQVTISKHSTAGPRHWPAQLFYMFMAVWLPTCVVIAGEPHDPFTRWPNVSDRVLAEQRGGFITADGLKINVGLEQLVMIDGTLKTQLNLDLSDLGRTPTGSAPITTNHDKQIHLIQNGEHNLVTSDVADQFGAGVLTIIQNSLDMKQIQNINLLQVDVAGTSQLRNNALARTIGRELVRSLR